MATGSHSSGHTILPEPRNLPEQEVQPKGAQHNANHHYIRGQPQHNVTLPAKDHVTEVCHA